MRELNESVKSIRETSVIRRIWMGVGSSALAQAIAAVQAIVLVPFFLRAWGADGYGRWLALSALASQLSLLDLGGQNFTANLLAMHHARGDTAAFRKTFSEAVSLFAFIGVGVFITFVLLLLGFLRFPLPGLGRPLETWEAWVLGLLGANLLILSIPGGVYVTAYRASGLFARGAMVGNMVRGLSIGVSVGLLSRSVRPEIYAAGMLGMGALLTAVIVWDMRRCIPGCRGLRMSIAETRKGWDYLGGAIYFWLIAVAQAARQQGVLLVLAAVASPAVVALYATHRTLANIPNYAGVLLQGPLLPELSFLWAQKHLSDLCRATFMAIKTVILVTGVLAIFLWLCVPLIYPVWTGRHLQVQPLLLGLLLIQGVLAAGWATSSWGLLAVNHHRPLAFWSLGNAAVTIGLAVWLGQVFGAVGVALAGLTGDFICGFAVFPILASFFLSVSASRMYTQIGSAALAVLPLAGVALLLSRVLNGWWAVWTFLLFGTALAYPIFCVAVGRSEARRFVRYRSSWVSGG